MPTALGGPWRPHTGISDSIGEESFPVSEPAMMACIDEHGGDALSALGRACPRSREMCVAR